MTHQKLTLIKRPFRTNRLENLPSPPDPQHKYKEWYPDRGLNTQHVGVGEEADEISMFLISTFIQKVKSQFTVGYKQCPKRLLFHERKEVKDRDISSRARTVTYLSYYTLFHSPLVGADKGHL
jgi:hypothetical protein